VTFLSPRELDRRLRHARQTRARELEALGVPPRLAKAQVTNEFAIYDRLVIDDRGWIHIEGLDLPPIERARGARPRRRRKTMP